MSKKKRFTLRSLIAAARRASGEFYPTKMKAGFSAQVARLAGFEGGGFKMRAHYQIEAFAPDGSLIFEDEFTNLVVDVGLNDILEEYFKGSAYTAAHYVMLTDGTPTVAAGDTMSSHAGWVEVVAYDEATREALTLGAVASQSVDNSASKASFTISANGTTIGGAGVTTDNTKSGTSGILYGAGAFTAGDVTLNDGDTLNVTVTLTSAAA